MTEQTVTDTLCFRQCQFQTHPNNLHHLLSSQPLEVDVNEGKNPGSQLTPSANSSNCSSPSRDLSGARKKSSSLTAFWSSPRSSENLVAWINSPRWVDVSLGESSFRLVLPLSAATHSCKEKPVSGLHPEQPCTPAALLSGSSRQHPQNRLSSASVSGFPSNVAVSMPGTVRTPSTSSRVESCPSPFTPNVTNSTASLVESAPEQEIMSRTRRSRGTPLSADVPDVQGIGIKLRPVTRHDDTETVRDQDGRCGPEVVVDPQAQVLSCCVHLSPRFLYTVTSVYRQKTQWAFPRNR